MIYFSFITFITFPMGQKFTYTQLVFGSIAFKLGQTETGAFWPIPPDRAAVTESGL